MNQEMQPPVSTPRRRFLRQLGFRSLALAALAAGGCRAVEPARDGEQLQEARFYQRLEGRTVQCGLCYRRCVIPRGERGFCRNRENVGGRLFSLVYGKPCAIQLDPVEKEPSYHILPGSTILCFSTASCNNRCLFCHNWHISQRAVEEVQTYEIPPAEAARMAIKGEALFSVVREPASPKGLSFTYAEPTVFYEYMYVASLGREQGLMALCHTNGLISPEPLQHLLEVMDAVTEDLKAFTTSFYNEICSSELRPVLESLELIAASGKHLEIVNLVIPSLNDDLGDIRRMCLWIAQNLGEEVPLHFNRFHPAYKLMSLPPTPVETLESARSVALEVGLEYVYIGNVPGHTYNSTFCPGCGRVLIRRNHFWVLEKHVSDGRCPDCGRLIPGIWKPRAD